MKPILPIAAVPLALLVAIAPALGAQAPSAVIVADSASSSSVRVDLPLLDAPYNVAHGLRGPSMEQSLAVSEGFYELSHGAIGRALGSRPILEGAALVLFDTFGSLLPGGDAWLHEEYHRAVMGNRGIGSFDDVYRMNLGASTIAVSHVRDEDLVALKAAHPAEQVRLGAAGIEAENQLVSRLEQNRFFHGTRANHAVFYWLTKLNSYFYVASGTTSEADELTDEANASDGADVPVRDFTGHDFTAWAYDLHRPTEPYSARGVHPSGVGIDRYVAGRDLTAEEHAFLNREGRLQLINFLDLNLVGIDGFTVRSPWKGADLRVNATASHYLTSFGHSIDLNVFLKQGPTKMFVVLRRYSNGARSFPGIDARLLDVPLSVAGVPLDVSPRVALWMQPEHQAFRATTARPGVLGALRIRQATSSRVAGFVELEGKTEGWVAGNVHLDPSVGVRIGGSVRLY